MIFALVVGVGNECIVEGGIVNKIVVDSNFDNKAPAVSDMTSVVDIESAPSQANANNAAMTRKIFILVKCASPRL